MFKSIFLFSFGPQLEYRFNSFIPSALTLYKQAGNAACTTKRSLACASLILSSVLFSAVSVAGEDITAKSTAAKSTPNSDTHYTLPGIPYTASAQHTQTPPIISDDHFDLVAQKGTDLYTTPKGEAKADNVPRLLFKAEGNFILTALVSSEFNADYDGGGLIVYGGKNQWAKLLIERVPGEARVVSSSVVNHKGDGAYHAQTKQAQIYLKLVRHKDSFFFYSSEDGKEWQVLRDFTLENIETAQVGFYSQSPLGKKVTTTFSDVSFKEMTITNYWQGE